MQKLALQLHVALSLIGILTGFVVMYGFITNQRFDAMTVVFLVTTIATSVTGFPPFFRFEKLLPSRVVGAISLVVLLVAAYARYEPVSSVPGVRRTSWPRSWRST